MDQRGEKNTRDVLEIMDKNLETNFERKTTRNYRRKKKGRDSSV